MKSSLAQKIDPTLMIGDAATDKEHIELVTQLDALIENPEAHAHSESFSEILSRLGTQISVHFDNEEQLMNRLGMPEDDVTRHVHAHSDILDEYTRLNFDLMDGQAFTRPAILALLKSWVIGHIVSHDLRIRDFLAGTKPVVREGNAAG